MRYALRITHLYECRISANMLEYLSNAVWEVSQGNHSVWECEWGSEGARPWALVPAAPDWWVEETARRSCLARAGKIKLGFVIICDYHPLSCLHQECRLSCLLWLFFTQQTLAKPSQSRGTGALISTGSPVKEEPKAMNKLSKGSHRHGLPWSRKWRSYREGNEALLVLKDV